MQTLIVRAANQTLQPPRLRRLALRWIDSIVHQLSSML